MKPKKKKLTKKEIAFEKLLHSLEQTNTVNILALQNAVNRILGERLCQKEYESRFKLSEAISEFNLHKLCEIQIKGSSEEEK